MNIGPRSAPHPGGIKSERWAGSDRNGWAASSESAPKRGRLWLNDGSCIRLRPEYPGHVWAYDFVEGRTHDGRKFRILTIIDEASRECLALVVARQLKHQDVLAALAELFVSRGPPAHIRSDNVLCREAAAGNGQQVSLRRV